MASIMFSKVDSFFEYAGMSPDERTHHLMMLNISPVLVMWLAAAFVLFAKVLGPKLMEGVEPFNLRGVMLFYNFTMSCFNMYAVYKVLPLSGYLTVLFEFDYPDRSDMSPHAIYLIHLGYMYLCTKLCDLFDTLFFIVRKKTEHITLLHVYHHTVVPVFGYLLMRINPILPACFLFALVNSIVHVIMYSYYALSAIGPAIQPYLWWKKYITILQLWQFVLYGLYGCVTFLFQRNYPIFWMYFALTQPPLFFWLFYDFYMKAYKYKPKRKHLNINHVYCHNHNYKKE